MKDKSTPKSSRALQRENASLKRQLVKGSMNKSTTNEPQIDDSKPLNVKDDSNSQELKTQTALFSKMNKNISDSVEEIQSSQDSNRRFYSDSLKLQRDSNLIAASTLNFMSDAEGKRLTEKLDSEDSIKGSEKPKIKPEKTKPPMEEKTSGGLSDFFTFTGAGIMKGLEKVVKFAKFTGVIILAIAGVFEVFSTMFDLDKLKEFGDPSKMNWGEKALAGLSSAIDFLSFGIFDKKMVYDTIHGISKAFYGFITTSVQKISDHLGTNEISAMFIKPIFDGAVEFVGEIGRFVGDIVSGSLVFLEKLWNSDDKMGFLQKEITDFITNISIWFSDKFDAISDALSEVVWDIKKWIYDKTGLDFLSDTEHSKMGEQFSKSHKTKDLNDKEKKSLVEDMKEKDIIAENWTNEQSNISDQEALKSLSEDQLKALLEIGNLEFEARKTVEKMIEDIEKSKDSKKVQATENSEFKQPKYILKQPNIQPEKNSKNLNTKMISQNIKSTEIPKPKVDKDYSGSLSKVDRKPEAVNSNVDSSMNNSNNYRVDNNSTVIIQGSNGSNAEKIINKSR